jgi:hypothetical protein
VNERNSNNKFSKEKVDNSEHKDQRISDPQNEANGAEECCHFSATQSPLGKRAIHHELVAVLQENVVSYSSMTAVSSEVILGLNSEEASSSPKDDGLDEVSEAILLALSDQPFCSRRQIGRRIGLPKSTVYRRLIDSLQFTGRHQASSLGSSQAVSSQQSAISRQVKSSCRSTFGTPVVHPASRIGWGHI